MQRPSAQSLADALNRRGGWRRATPSKRQSFMAICPNHADKNPSLSIRETESGKILLHCFAPSCSDKRAVYQSVEAAMNFEAGFLGGPITETVVVRRDPVRSKAVPTTPILPIPVDVPAFSIVGRKFRSKSHGAPVRAWCYKDANGHALAYVARYERKMEDGRTDKMVWPWIYGIREGKRGWYVNSLPEPRPLYNLDLIASKPDAIVQIHEGEKAADAGAQLFPEWVSTTTLGGGNAPHLADLTPLTGRKVVICPDNDSPGVEYALHIAELLAPIAAEIRILRLPTVRLDPNDANRLVPYHPNHGDDAADYVDAGFTTKELKSIVLLSGTGLTWQIDRAAC